MTRLIATERLFFLTLTVVGTVCLLGLHYL